MVKYQINIISHKTAKKLDELLVKVLLHELLLFLNEEGNKN